MNCENPEILRETMRGIDDLIRSNRGERQLEKEKKWWEGLEYPMSNKDCRIAKYGLRV
jgi:hypothetical protein